MSEKDFHDLQVKFELLHTAVTAFIKKTELELKELKEQIVHLELGQVMLIRDTAGQSDPKLKEMINEMLKGLASRADKK